MAKSKIDEIYARLEQASKDKPSGAANKNGPIERFKTALNKEIAKIDAAMTLHFEGKDMHQNFNSRSDWFKKVPGGYGFEFGRLKPALPNGKTYMEAKSLEELKGLMLLGLDLVEDQHFSDQIIAKSDERSKRMSGGKKKSATKK